MHIHCENCNTPIPAANINIQDKIAVCPSCNTVFSFSLQRKAKQRKVKKPPEVTIHEGDSGAEMILLWRHMLKPAEYWILGIFVLLGVVFGAVAGSALADVQSFMQGLFGGMFLLGALGCLYLIVSTLLNQVRVTVDDETIRVKHGPLPLGINRQVAREEVIHIHCDVGNNHRNVERGSEMAYYNVKAECRDGRAVSLATLHRDAAFYVAQVIENYLVPEFVEEAEEVPNDDLLVEIDAAATITAVNKAIK
ncbi:MAG TPA: hypothetical protein VHP83_00555 [Aggregatilineaceae bacterium]|nr:hypothetical protein [Aggregatilineaceae bacterium]